MSSTDLDEFLESPIEGKLRDRLAKMRQRYAELTDAIADPERQKDRQTFQSLLKEHGGMVELADLFDAYLQSEADLVEAKSMAESDDPELQELGVSELESCQETRASRARAVREHILDQEVDSADSCIVEIRAGTGGDEAALFAADLFRMYSAYGENHRWKFEILSESATDLGGYKEIIFAVRGPRAHGVLQFESGGHRVQRVPETETQGRIHTSAVTVAVMEEVEESQIDIKDNDLRIDTFCASGPGGQKVNKTSSAVRITHIPTGIVVSIQDEKSQHKNKAKAMKVLASRLKEKQEQERRDAEAQVRRSLIGSGDRSDRIRTYNFPQNRLTDHRIGLTLYNLDRAILGDLDDLFSRLEAHDREERVAAL
ncbi:MAG: peptide chain release factor 1 [Planctomycetes bacterium]|nr:peptide chain release factor 1 [Planctomycetota bacterium]